jgi:ankyrin repeat protein
LEHKADVEALDNERATSLHLAVDNGRIEVARVLLESGANAHALNQNGQTPLQIASEKGNQEITALLRECLSRE